MESRLMPDPKRFAQMSTAELRSTFLLDGLFAPGEVRLVHCDVDRTVIGGVVPLDRPVELPNPPELRATSFAERREIGVLNIGGRGRVTVGEESHTLESLDCLYVGRGARAVRFDSENPEHPARFYLLSYPAHHPHPTRLISRANEAASAARTQMGSETNANRRTISKYIYRGEAPDAGVPSCQLVMGVTRLESGSVWNTMPPHTHSRRSEVYLYFDLAPEARVVHLMGPPDETRHLIVANEQAVVSPAWSIHSGAGTARYSFCWGMGGENQDYADMDAVPIAQLR